MKTFAKLSVLSMAAWFQTSVASGYTLSEEAFFARCYQKLTQVNIGYYHDTVKKIREDSSVSAADECIALLKSVELDFDTAKTIPNEQRDALNVLHHMHALHASWFANSEFLSLGANVARLGTAGMRDSSSPASYYTMALFSDSMDFREILTSNKEYYPIRRLSTAENRITTLGYNDARYDDPTKYESIWQGTWWITKGNVVGFGPRATTQLKLKDNYVNTGATETAERFRQRGQEEITLLPHQGGGFLGATDYIMLNKREVVGYKQNGAVKAARQWSKAALKDALCRELPAVTAKDAEPFVDTTASATFRHAAQCAACHTTTDRMAGVIRHLDTYTAPGRNLSPLILSGFFLKKFGNHGTASLPAEEKDKIWPSKAVDNFHLTPPTGHFIYRNRDGSLTDKSIGGIAELGQVMANTPDFPLCIASRYYTYFMGIELNLAQIHSATSTHAKKVLELTEILKNTKKTSKVVEAIIKMPEFRQFDYGLGVAH